MKQIFLSLSSIRWQDAVDIAFNSYVLFRLYALFRQTDAFRVLVGIVFLWLFQRIAVSLGLILTSWVIQGIIAVAALIVIVVFRNEIRAVFRARNLRAILWEMPRKVIPEPLEVIVESAYQMAQKGIGALIVIPGREDIDDVVQKGIPWDGLISEEMITSIFWKNNPVHDGAAIVCGNHIAEVGTVLPLSHRKDLPSYYGTRHRAAAGLAERTDALVIVVSEERGDMTVAKGTEMHKIRSKQRLSRILREHAGIITAQPEYYRKEKIELGTALLVSVLVVSGVWFSISRGLNIVKTCEVPVAYANQNPDMTILNTSVTSVKLYLNGSGALIRSIRPEQIRATINLDRAVAGTNTFPITNDNVSLPPGISLKEAKPMEVKVTLDMLGKKKIPIQIDWTGKLPEELILVTARPKPGKIEVSGPQGVLDDITTIYTEPVPLETIKRSGTLTAKPVIPSPLLKIDSDSKNRISAKITVKRRSRPD